MLSQMYVPGKLKNCDKVLVDVGTGYYVEKVSCLNHHIHCNSGHTECSVVSGFCSRECKR